MNIICNDCVGGRLYKLLNKIYTNPFIWLNVLDDDFLYLIQNYKDINFLNYEFKLLSNSEHMWTFRNDALLSTICVDNHIMLYYTHHLYSKNYHTLTLLSDKRYMYDNIELIVKDRYERLVKRMIEANEEPIFVFHDWNHYKNIDLLINAANANNYRIVILTNLLESKNLNKAMIINYNAILPNSTDPDGAIIAEYLLQNKII